MLERKKSRDDITFQSGWRKVVKLMDLAKARLVTEETIVELETEEVIFCNLTKAFRFFTFK